MASEEENFELDVYGDGNMTYSQDAGEEEETKADLSEPTNIQQVTPTANSTFNGPGTHQDIKLENGHTEPNAVAQKIASTDDSAQDVVHLPKQAPQAQGLKRKDGFDDRTVDPGATIALFISDLHWWVTDDDIRGWANQSGCEDEFVDVTFSEHKVNGKSKGQAYALFKSPQAATAVKQKVESLGKSQKYRKKFTVYYTSPLTNPFHTLPKEGPMRVSNNPANSNHPAPGSFRSTRESSTIPIQQTGFHVNTSGSGYRGRGGGNNNRGVGMNNMPNYNRGGFQQPMTGGFQANPMGGFQGTPMVGMPPYGGFQNRGGAMMGGIRGGRGGMSPAGGMMGMQMGNMGMGAMGAQMNGLGMAMSQMGAPMGMPGTQASHNFTSGKSAGSFPHFFNQARLLHPMSRAVGPFTTSAHSAVHNRSAANHAGAICALTQTTGQYKCPTTPAGQHSSAAGGDPLREGISGSQAPPTEPKGPKGASLSQYTSSGPSHISTSSSSQSFTLASSITPASFEQNIRLNASISSAGQVNFQGAQAQYHPVYYQQPQPGHPNVGVGDSTWNPHGAKRTRRE